MANKQQVWARTGRKRKRPQRTKDARYQKRQLFGNRKRRPCTYCGIVLTVETATVDHVVPVSKGGYQKLANVTLACSRCNQRKRSMSREAFIALLAKERAHD